MDPALLDRLRDVLLELPPTGDGGFESLLAKVFGTITGIPFRLASSGSQFGKDGRAAYGGDAICFEAKRYSGSVSRSDVLGKLAELSLAPSESVDLWVLCATTPIGTQVADSIEEFGRSHGISTMILDWSEEALPPLSVALAMARAATADFIATHGAPSGASKAELTRLLGAVEADPQFAPQSERVRAALLEPNGSLALARSANDAWLRGVFGDPALAKRFLAQPLAPDDKASKVLARGKLVEAVMTRLCAAPSGEVWVIVGGEGNGKSWLMAQSWLALDAPPLTLVFTADEFAGAQSEAPFVDRMIEKCVAQTGGTRSDRTEKAWRRNLKRWERGEAPDQPRMIVVIDGLNQRAGLDWRKILERVSAEVFALGGLVIATTRAAHFSSHLRQASRRIRKLVEVPEWTATERDELLVASGMSPSDLSGDVARSLRNPRLLSIALALITEAQIKRIGDLSVSRLLFEHIRMHGEVGPEGIRRPHAFARNLRVHAEEVLLRHKERVSNDLRVFEGGVGAVVDSRFFHEVDGDPTRYRIDDDGLILALGFAIIDHLRSAHRNGVSLDVCLERLVDPIASLDAAAGAVLAALTIACIDDSCPQSFGSALLTSFATLQNPNEELFGPFSALAEQHTAAFMEAAKRLCLAQARVANLDWIENALAAARQDPDAWAVMSKEIADWLGHYNLDPGLRMPSAGPASPAYEHAREVQQRREKISARIDALSASESEFLGGLTHAEGDVDALAVLAFSLLAQRPLAKFSAALVKWSFAAQLNMGMGCPYEHFVNLIRFNGVDWAETRAEVLTRSAWLTETGVSLTGQWAYVSLLRGIGDAQCGAREEDLVDVLAVHHPHGGWRLVERYCSSDPCDPGSERPENIAETAQDYAAIDVSKVRQFFGPGGEDHLFGTARAGVARFEPAVAIAKHQEFISHVASRSGLALRQGILETGSHGALVDEVRAREIVAQLADGTIAAATAAMSADEQRFIAQYHLLVAFPLLSATEQIQSIMADAASGAPFLETLVRAKALDESTYEQVVLEALRSGDREAITAAIAFGDASGSAVSSRVREALADLMTHEDEVVRAVSMGLAASAGCSELGQALLESDWSAWQVERRRTLEGWNGSRLILLAMKGRKDLLGSAMSKIDPSAYSLAIADLGAVAAEHVAKRVEASIKACGRLVVQDAPPEIEAETIDSRGRVMPRLSIERRARPASSLTEMFRSDMEEIKQFADEQAAAHEEFDRFRDEVDARGAGFVLDVLGVDDLVLAAERDQQRALRWADELLGLPRSAHPAAYNLAMILARAVSPWAPATSVELFAHYEGSAPFVRRTFERVGMPLSAVALWSSADDPVLGALRTRRLDTACDDHALALEVATAEWRGKNDCVDSYIDRCVQSEEPSKIARGLMVAGLSADSALAVNVLDEYGEAKGFLGTVAKAAREAASRHAWAMHWYSKMREAESPDAFWCCSVLFLKVVDGRFEISCRQVQQTAGAAFTQFWPSVERQLRNRYAKVQRARAKKLFGQTPPAKWIVAMHPRERS